MKRGSNASTMILVALLIGVLFVVGKVVNPPTKGGHDDHDHASESSAPAPTSTPPQKGAPAKATDREAAMKARSEQMAKMDAIKKEHMTPPKPPVRTPLKPGAAPKSDGMDASYWQENNMGPVAAKPTASAH